MTAEILKTKAEQGYAAQFDATAADETLPAWVTQLRDEAMTSFNAIGLPHRRVEEWKYTDLRARISEVYGPAGGASGLDGDALAALLGPLAEVDAARLVLVNGILDEALSDLAKLSGHCEVLSLPGALSEAPDWVKDALTKVKSARTCGCDCCAQSGLSVVRSGASRQKRCRGSLRAADHGYACHGRGKRSASLVDNAHLAAYRR